MLTVADITRSVMTTMRTGITRSVMAAVLAGGAARAGWIEALPDRTVIHVTVHDWMWEEINPVRTDTSVRANVEAVREFRRRFPALFAERYRARYEADPARYGDRNWERVEVRVEKFSGLKVEGVETDLLAIAGRVPPDIIYLNFRKSDTYIQQGFLYPLDRPEDGYFTAMSEAERDWRIHPKVAPVIRRVRAGEEHVWAVPHGGAIGKVLIYRKDRFDEAGLAYPDASWTWDDLRAACRALADPGRGRYAIALRNTKHESWRWMDFLMAAGSEVLRYDEATDAWDVAFDNPRTVAALDYYVTLCTEPWTDEQGRKRRGYAFRDSSWTYGDQQWKNGNIAMLLGTIQEDVFSKSFDPTIIGLAPMPIGPTGLRASAINAKMLSLYAEIEEPAVRDAAWEFIRFYDSEEAVRIKTRVLVAGGLGRFVNPKYLERFGYEDLVRFAPPGWKETFEIAVEHSQPEPYGRFANPIYDILDRPIKEANALAVEDKLPRDPEARAAELEALINAAAARARREILGETPPEELRTRRATAAVFLVLLTAVFAFVLRRVFRAYKPPAVPGEAAPSGPEWRRHPLAYLLLLPALATIFFWRYLPLLRGSVMAFQDYQVMGGSEFVWLDNFGEVLWSRDWWASVWNALRYSFLVIALTFLPPVGLAILLQEVPRGKILFRTLYYLPAVITSLVVILLWKSFYGANETGLLNRLVMSVPAVVFLVLGVALAAGCMVFAVRLLRQESWGGAAVCLVAAGLLFAACQGLAAPSLGLRHLPWWQRLFASNPEATDWLGSRGTAMMACVLPLFWAGVGPGCLIYLAALKGIPNELYEAADMDGATFTDKVLFIVLPIFKPLLVINFVGLFIGAWFHAEANILAMTGGGAGTEVAGLHIFYKAFLFLKFGPATAMAWILGVFLIFFTMVQLRMLARLEFRAGG